MVGYGGAVGIALVTLTLLFSSAQADDGERANFCHDPQTNQQRGKLIEEAPDDDILMRLFALRLGLCEMVDAGQLDLERATEIFEDARRGAAVERGEEERQERPGDGARGLYPDARISE